MFLNKKNDLFLYLITQFNWTDYLFNWLTNYFTNLKNNQFSARIKIKKKRVHTQIL